MNKYEALGRYIVDKEELAKRQHTRENFANQMLVQVQDLQGKGSVESMRRIAFDLDKTLEHFREINHQCAKLVEQINQYAEICERPKVS